MSASSTVFSPMVKGCLVIIACSAMLAAIGCLGFGDYLLHQAGTLIAVLLLLWLRKLAHTSDTAFVAATLFLLVHIVGARYLYSSVPYSEWTQALFGFSLDDWLGWQRNMYDRWVHFCYGLLLFPTFYQLIQSCFPTSSHRQLLLITLLVNMASSLVYEWVEWLLAMTLSPEAAEAYNGQQGDMWDAHKDMLLAFVGTIIAIGVSNFVSKYNK